MAILVTGGAGYIGSHTCVELLNAGYDVVVADNLYNSSKKAVDRVEQITGKKLKFYEVDLLDQPKVKEIFDKAQKLRKAKSTKKLANGTDQVVINRRYAFSSMLKCGYCGKNLVRKQWHSNSKYSKAVWYCSEPCRKGVKYCPNAKAISESVLEEAFVESYNRLCDNKQDVLEDLLAKIKTILKKEKIEEAIKQTDESIQKIKVRRNKLLNEYLNGTIPQDIYEENERLLKTTLLNKKNELKYLKKQLDEKDNISNRISEFRKNIMNNPILEEFDRVVFESIVEKAIVGGFDENGNKDPYKITFIYKTGIQDEIKEAKKKFVAKAYEQKEKDTEMYSFSSNDQNNMCTNDNGNIDRNIHGNHCSNGTNRNQCGTGSTLKCCNHWSSSDRRFLFWR